VSQRLSRVGFEFEFEDEDKDGNFVLVALRFEGSLEANGIKKLTEIVYDPLIELSTGTLFSFPADWGRQILKIVLVLELVLVLGFVRPLAQFAEVASNDAPDFPGARVVRHAYVSDPLKALKSRGGGRVSIRFPGEPSALERGPLPLRKEATFSPLCE